MNNKMNQNEKFLKGVAIIFSAIAIITLVVNIVMNGVQSIYTWTNVCKVFLFLAGTGCGIYGFINRERIKLGYVVMLLSCAVGILGTVTIIPILS